MDDTSHNVKRLVRYAFSFQVEQIPGEPGARSLTIANAFMQNRFQRDFSWQDDYVYTPANIDQQEGRAFMLLDINKGSASTVMINNLDIKCFKVIVKDSM